MNINFNLVKELFISFTVAAGYKLNKSHRQGKFPREPSKKVLITKYFKTVSKASKPEKLCDNYITKVMLLEKARLI